MPQIFILKSLKKICGICEICGKNNFLDNFVNTLFQSKICVFRGVSFRANRRMTRIF